MFAAIKLENNAFDLLKDKKIMKSIDYLNYVESLEIVKQAQEEASQIRAKFEEEFELNKQKGFELGMEESKKKHSYEIQNTLAACNEYYFSIENELIIIVMEALNQILDSFTDIELTRKIVKSILTLVCNEKKVILHVNPEQLSDARNMVSDLLKDFPNIQYIDLLPDERLQSGGAILETDIGVIDSNLENQLSALEKALKDNVGNYVDLPDFSEQKKKIKIDSDVEVDKEAYKEAEQSLQEKIKSVKNKKVKVHFSTSSLPS